MHWGVSAYALYPERFPDKMFYSRKADAKVIKIGRYPGDVTFSEELQRHCLFCRWVLHDWCFLARLERLVGSCRLSSTSEITLAVQSCSNLRYLIYFFPHSHVSHSFTAALTIVYHTSIRQLLWHTYCIIISYSTLQLQIRVSF